MARMMLGLEPFVADINILLEGYQHYTRLDIVGFCLLTILSLYNHHLLLRSFNPTFYRLTCALRSKC